MTASPDQFSVSPDIIDKENHKKAYNTAKELADKIHVELERIIEIKPNGSDLYFENQKMAFSKEGLGEMDLTKYIVWHGLVGSSPKSDEEAPYIDLPGDHNLMAIFNERLEVLKKVV